MVERTLTDEIITLINSQIDNVAKPVLSNIIKVYPDNIHVDVVCTYGVLEYVQTFGKAPEVDMDCLIIFINGSFDIYVGIC